VNKIGITSNEIACAGGITNVRSAIAAAGSPIPRKPLTIPDRKKTQSIKTSMFISLEGNKIFQISLFISLDIH
tara:strand:- start:554 stop:772 length:219 start_codon:yes stop_codon:yes gene_type:complete